MASTYVNDLRLNEMATGDGSGTWGTTTNTNLELIAEAFSYGTEVITTNADTHTTTIADGATDPGRSLYLKYTGTLDSACTITIGPNTVSKVWIIENGTSGSQDIILSQGSGANITIPAGDTKVVYSDGAGAGAAFFDAFASLSVVDLKVQDDLTVTGDIDVDGTTNLDVVDIDGAVNMATTALVTGVLTTTAATVFNGGFASNAASTISTADNLDTLSLISTDADANSGPNLRLYRNSGSPADSDVLGHIQYEGRNDNSQDVVYSEILTLAADVADGTEDAIVYIQSMVAGTVRERISILPGETVFNENSVDLDFRVESDNDANALFVQGSDGNVGIGTASPGAALEVNSGGGIHLSDNTAGRTLIIKPSLSGAIHEFTSDNTSAGFAFSNDTSELLRIDASGALLVGTTTSAGAGGVGLIGQFRAGYQGVLNGFGAENVSSLFYSGGASGGYVAINSDSANSPLYISLTSSATAPSFITFSDTGANVGSINAEGSELAIGSTAAGLQFLGSEARIRPFNISSNAPTDNTIDLGRSNSRFQDIYATNGTINTSDRNEKQDIETLTDAETRVAVAAKGLLRKFRWIDSVEEKGDEARIHFGIIAQDLQDAFTAEGLDAGDYAMFISDTWTDDDGVEQTRLGIRYSELLAFIIAAI
jgi:hypothetical protein